MKQKEYAIVNNSKENGFVTHLGITAESPKQAMTKYLKEFPQFNKKGVIIIAFQIDKSYWKPKQHIIKDHFKSEVKKFTGSSGGYIPMSEKHIGKKVWVIIK